MNVREGVSEGVSDEPGSVSQDHQQGMRGPSRHPLSLQNQHFAPDTPELAVSVCE